MFSTGVYISAQLVETLVFISVGTMAPQDEMWNEYVATVLFDANHAFVIVD